MVVFVTNCCENLEEVGIIALLLRNRDFLKCIFSCNYIKVEAEIQRCLRMYVSSNFRKHCCGLCKHFLNAICATSECFFTFCFGRVSNIRTNYQGHTSVGGS